jgi:hypothetical protein
MRIYSKTGETYNFDLFKFPVKKIEGSVSGDVAFYHNFRDCIRHGFKESLDAEHWLHLKNTDSIFIYENWYEPENTKILAIKLSTVITEFQINPSKFFIILADELYVASLFSELLQLGITGLNIDYYTKCLKDTVIPKNIKVIPDKKFSALSRRYLKDRLLFFFELINQDILADFVYSFHNINPYTFEKYSPDTLKKELSDMPMTSDISNWIDNVPYLIEDSKSFNNFSDDVYTTMLRSNVHIVIETMYNDTIYSLNKEEIVPWITEKTYKAIACKRLFLHYALPGSLAALQQMGFKTFGNFIDETYDTITDPACRRIALVSEIKKLSNLSNTEMIELLNNVEDILEHNFKLLCNKQEKTWCKIFLDLEIFNESIGSHR